MAPKSTIHEEYFWCSCATWACFRKGFQGFRGIRRWKNIKKTRITENRESPRSKRGCLVGNSRVVHVVSSPNRRWSTTAGITLFLYQQEFLLRAGVCWRTDMSLKWMVADFLQRCHTNRRRQTPKTPACTRLWTARVDFAKRTSLHASTLSPLIQARRFARVRCGGCKRNT